MMNTEKLKDRDYTCTILSSLMYVRTQDSLVGRYVEVRYKYASDELVDGHNN